MTAVDFERMTGRKWLAIVGACLLLLVIALSWTEHADRAANVAFGEKARANNIEGKSEDAIRQLFGAPDSVYRSAYSATDKPYHVLVYTPGPRFCIWNSQCKISIDDSSNTVTGWMINSD